MLVTTKDQRLHRENNFVIVLGLAGQQTTKSCHRMEFYSVMLKTAGVVVVCIIL